MSTTRTRPVRDINALVRKHKRTHNHPRRLPAAPERPAIPAQIGIASVGSEEST